MSSHGQIIVPTPDNATTSFNRRNPQWALEITVAQAMNMRGYTAEQEDRWQYEHFRGNRESIVFFHSWRSWRGDHSILYVDWSNPHGIFVFPLEFLDEFHERTKDRRTVWEMLMGAFQKSPDFVEPVPKYEDPRDYSPEIPLEASRIVGTDPVSVNVVQDVCIPEEAAVWAREVFPLYLMEKYHAQPDPWLAWENDNEALPLHDALIPLAKNGYHEIRAVVKG